MEDGTVVPDLDVIIFCTGYDYSFPFLSPSIGVTWDVGTRRVGPLYKQLFHPLNPSLSFIGLPHSVVPFPLFEAQAMLVAESVKSGFENLPGREERVAEANADYVGMGPNKSRIADTHYLGPQQWDYCLEMVSLVGDGLTDEEALYFKTNEEIYNHAGEKRKECSLGGKDGYREMNYFRDHDTQVWGVLEGERINEGVGVGK